MERRYRATLVNSLPGYKCLHMIGTRNLNGSTNLGLFNSVFHLGADPALLGVIFRPNSKDHDTLKNIVASKCYSLNNVLPEWYEQAHQTSARYPSGQSEFQSCNFSEHYISGFNAPFVAESSIKIGMKLREIIELKINGTTMVIGEIINIDFENEIIDADGHIDHKKARTVTIAGLDAYYTAEPIARLPYAKPNL